MHRYYHGSVMALGNGDVIFPHPNGYTWGKEVKALEDLLEDERPDTVVFGRRECVFLASEIEDIDNLGGSLEHVYVVDVADNPVETSDLSWYTRAGELLSEGDQVGARSAAKKYWSGECLEGVYEYRTAEAYVVKSI